MLLNKIIFLSKRIKLGILLSNDFFLCLVSSIILIYFVYKDSFHVQIQYIIIASVTLYTILLCVFFYKGIYKSIIRYSSIISVIELFRQLINFCIISIFTFFLLSFFGFFLDSYAVIILLPIITASFVFISRIIMTIFVFENSSDLKKNILIYGAGEAGLQIVNALLSSKNYRVIGLIDDDESKISRSVSNIEVYSSNKIKSLVQKFFIKDIFIAIPSLTRKQRQKIINSLEGMGLKTKILPPIKEIIDGKVSFNDFKEPNLEDLINRNIVFNKENISNLLSNKIVLITGAGGSIGSELSKQVLSYNPKELILLDHSELNLYNINNELKIIASNHKGIKSKICATLGSINDKELISQLLETSKPELIYHAAAYKHVPLIEENIFTGIDNNIFGTINLVETVLRSKSVNKFIMISTDKAVRPTNIMGKSKRIAELYIQSLRNYNHSNIEFSIVRFGNVLGSSGSVVPLFYEQLAKGGPITVTHREVTRFLMSIEEAVGLILTASHLSRGNEIFLLDMGDPIRILDLAKKIINLSGLKIKDNENTDGDIEIVFTGLRPGEKLIEELLVHGDTKKTEFKFIYQAIEPCYDYKHMTQEMAALKKVNLSRDREKVLEKLNEIIKIDLQ
jgi:FlaA1/EpsC-like NDP-sugar epimerase